MQRLGHDTHPAVTPRGRAIIIGAGGRDFHNFNLLFRDNADTQVVAFTAAQIPNIAGRRYPPALAGPLYPDGIPIVPESDLAGLIRREAVDWVYFSYSDVAHVDVMHCASVALAAGAGFGLLSPRATMLQAGVPVISVCAVRTGAGKSAVSRHILRWLRGHGHRPVAIRHPMPYGDLERQAVQRFGSYADLDAAAPTVEEREEYEPYLDAGAVVFAGVDYGRILHAAEQEADVILWDGGNNDLPFLRPDLHIVLLDACRPGHELTYHPGETNLRMADVLVVMKVDSASATSIDQVVATATAVRPSVPVIFGDLAISVDAPDLIAGRRVTVVGDGPTLTHGGLAVGAGSKAARTYGAREVVHARPYAVGSLADTFRAFPHLGPEIPAMGYSAAQITDLEATLRQAPADVIVDGSPVHLARLLDAGKPIVSVQYEFVERGQRLPEILISFEQQVLRCSVTAAD
jgi:predicted GTPase